MTHKTEEHDPPWTTDEDAAAARRRQETTEQGEYVGRHGTRQPQEGLGIGNAPLDDPFKDAADRDDDADGTTGHRDPAEGTQGERTARRFNESEPREGPAWADRPEGGGVRRHGTGTPDSEGANAEKPGSVGGDAPVEEITPEDLPEVGETYAQPGAPFEVQGPDRP